MARQFLNKEWCEDHLKKIKKRAGDRYTPKLNVSLPVSEIFDGLSRNKEFYFSIRTHRGELDREFSRISKKYQSKKIQKSYESFSKNVITLLEGLKKIKDYNTKSIDWKLINQSANKANESGWKLVDELRDEKERLEQKKVQEQFEGQRYPSERLSSDMHHIYEIQKELRYFMEYSSSSTARLANNPFLFLKGLAGSGKTHLLCDLMEKRINEDSLSVLVFGEFFTAGDVWAQLRTQLGLNQKYDKNKILELLDKKGKKLKTRSIVIIDALNESKPDDLWYRKLGNVYNEVSKYPNIALLVSVRSGFEQEVLSQKMNSRFVIEEHHGFRFQEWEAVSKFFGEFSLPLPEIPVLTPEFQNPLFLLLFCKAFEGRAKKNESSRKPKQIFRGHEGATYIFESFVKSIANRIAKEFDLPSGRTDGDYVIWDTVIEKVAEEMVEQDVDRVTEEKIETIVTTSHPDTNAAELITALEKNLLLVKVPRYSSESHENIGFDFRFPFQKFSDHLIGRYIFKKLRQSEKTPERFFSKRTKIGKFLAKSWNRGVIEALCIQFPEQLNGKEFFEVAPYVDDWVITEAFIESLVWRRLDAFTEDTKETISFINQRVLRRKDWHDALLNAFLTISTVPEHPFNAQFLHRHLSKFTMPRRDSWWCPFVHYQYGNKEAVDRLIDWAWSNRDKSHINDESVTLYAIALAWFLSSSNRFARDKSTKALTSLLTGRLNVLVKVLEQFRGVNDPYIQERLYAVAYGCTLRDSSNKTHLKQLALWFVNNIFKTDKLPTHILTRDYARGTVEIAFREGVIGARTYNKTKPPYKSYWPQRIPTEKNLRKKYYPEDLKSGDRGYLGIWSSVMYAFGSLGDFGKYEIDPALGHWSGRQLSGQKVYRKKLFEEFKKTLNSRQIELLNEGNPLFGMDLKTLRLVVKYTKPEDEVDEEELKREAAQKKRDRKSAIKELKQSLSSKQKKHFESEVQPYLDDRGGVNDPLDNFDTALAQRWIFNRVIQFGWDPQVHGEFDSAVKRYDSYGRSANKPERIGKKYQWIALFELLAMVSDNFEFKESSWSEKSSVYEGAWQLWIRDIDPSCTLHDAPIVPPADVPQFTNLVPKYNAWQQNNSISTWIKSAKKLPKPGSLIELTDTEGRKWIVLEGFCEWQEETLPEYKRYDLPTRTLYYMFKSYLVKDGNRDKFYRWGKRQRFYGRWMPESHEFIQIFLGEYSSYPAFLNTRSSDWIHEVRHGKKKVPCKVLVTDEEYLNESSTHDCSIQESINVKLPAKWIVDKMKLQQKCTDGRFYDRQGDLVICYPAAFNRQPPSLLLMRKDKLRAFLKKTKCSIFWSLLGEKQTIGGGGIGQPHGWQEISGIYTLDGRGTLKGVMNTRLETPTDQKNKKVSKPKKKK